LVGADEPRRGQEMTARSLLPERPHVDRAIPGDLVSGRQTCCVNAGGLPAVTRGK